MFWIYAESDCTFLLSRFRSEVDFIRSTNDGIKGNVPWCSELVFENSFIPKSDNKFIFLRIGIDARFDGYISTGLWLFNEVGFYGIIANNNFEEDVSSFVELVLKLINVDDCELVFCFFIFLCIFDWLFFCYNVYCFILEYKLTHYFILFVQDIHFFAAVLVPEFFRAELVAEDIRAAFIFIYHAHKHFAYFFDANSEAIRPSQYCSCHLLLYLCLLIVLIRWYFYEWKGFW